MLYLDCNASTPIEPEVQELVVHYLTQEFGNAGSRTHEFGIRAHQAVERARRQIAEVVKSEPSEVIFTSGATESNNIAILGLEQYARTNNKNHIITTTIEHKAVIEPIKELQKRGFEVTRIDADQSGRIDADQVNSALRKDTFLASIMHVNNETGIKQPIAEISQILANHEVYFHTDAAQSFGKEITTLQNKRIDLISISGHKIYAPKGIGALIVLRRGYDKIPLQPITFGGGQERGLRPGTLPVHLIAGLGLAAELALKNYQSREQWCQNFKAELLENFRSLDPEINGDLNFALPSTISIAFPGIDSEALMLSLKNEIAISNGSACTSQTYQPSHVLKAMNITDEIIKSTVRISWCHLSERPAWGLVKEIIN